MTVSAACTGSSRRSLKVSDRVIALSCGLLTPRHKDVCDSKEAQEIHQGARREHCRIIEERPDGTTEPNDYCYEVLLVRLFDGNSCVIDLAGAQYGQSPQSYPLRLIRRTLQEFILELNRLVLKLTQ